MSRVRPTFDPEKVREPGTALDAELDAVSQRVIGAAIEVHRQLGPGFAEALYEEALAFELELRDIAFSRQHKVTVEYKGRPVGEGILDFLVEDKLVVELKSVESLTPLFTGQVVSYLRATKLTRGLLINFNVELLKQGLKRVVL